MIINWIQLAVTPIIALILGFIGWYLRSRVETIRREKDKLQEEQRKIYIHVLEPFIRIFAGIKNPLETKKATKQMLSVEYRMMSLELNLMGSDDVVGAVNDFMQYIYRLENADTSAKPEDILVYWGGVLLAIRRDLGNKKTKLSEVDMLRGQIKDIDKIVKS